MIIFVLGSGIREVVGYMWDYFAESKRLGCGYWQCQQLRNAGREWLFIVRRNDRGKVYEEEEGRFKEDRPSAGEEGEVGSQQFAGKRKPPIS